MTRLLILLLLFPPLAAFSAALELSQPAVTLQDLAKADAYYIHGMFETSADPAEVWRVLSDYEGLKGVLSNLQSSQVLERKSERALVEQVMVGQFMFFRKAVRLRLQVREQAPWRIEFASAEARPFRRYEGAWQIERTPMGCRVDYTLTVSRGDMAPAFLERQLFRENSRGLLQELSQEVTRRAQQGTILVKATPPAPAHGL